MICTNKALMKVRSAINKALEEEMASNKKIFIIGEEVGKSGGTYKVTSNLYDKFGRLRVVDTPISEMGFTGLAVGASYKGLIPVCEFMTWNFALQAIDHIINSSAKMRYMSGGMIGSSIVFRGPNGYSPGVGAQHTHDFLSWFANVPGLKVVAPFSAKDHYGIMKGALRDGNPVVILENEVLYDHEFEDVNLSGVQEFKCVTEIEGSDCTILGISLNLLQCIDAAKRLKNEGIEAEVINLLSIRPLDIETIIESVKKTGKIIIVDNGWPVCGIASEITMRLYECEGLNVVVKRINGRDTHTAYAENLERLTFPSSDEIVEVAQTLVKK